MRATIFALLAACAPSGAVDPWAACEDPAGCGEEPQEPAHVSRMGGGGTTSSGATGPAEDDASTSDGATTTSGTSTGGDPTTGAEEAASTGTTDVSGATSTGTDEPSTGDAATSTGEAPPPAAPQPPVGMWAECYQCADELNAEGCVDLFENCQAPADPQPDGCVERRQHGMIKGPTVAGFCSRTCETAADCPQPDAAAVPACVNKGDYTGEELYPTCVLLCAVDADCPGGMTCDAIVHPAFSAIFPPPRICW